MGCGASAHQGAANAQGAPTLQDAIPFSANWATTIEGVLGHKIAEADTFETAAGVTITGKQLLDLKDVKSAFPIKVKKEQPKASTDALPTDAPQETTDTTHTKAEIEMIIAKLPAEDQARYKALLVKADKVFDTTDKNGDCALSKGELAILLKQTQKTTRAKAIKATPEELDAKLSETQKPPKESVTGCKDDEKVQKIMDLLDTDQSGKVDADEWDAWIKELLVYSGPDHVEELLARYEDRLVAKKAEFVFKRMAKDIDAVVTKQGLLVLLNNPDEVKGLNVESEDVKKLMNKMDTDKDGVVSYEEWLGYIAEIKASSGVTVAFQVLEKYELNCLIQVGDKLHAKADADGNKELTYAELSYMLRQTKNRDNVQSFITENDLDANGTLNSKEFRLWVKNVFESTSAEQTWKVMEDWRRTIDDRKAAGEKLKAETEATTAQQKAADTAAAQQKAEKEAAERAAALENQLGLQATPS